ncbi:hypothetical protein FKW77_003750 [Venturia effusa]|uniref:Uncharacterized protein n=1 Tax=Venturia effusa TaxID=50376 RepID=A0A517LIF8_9PEZI|nr:hypothetical protein FKW77_003750 [Venturia effusa]
MVLAAPIAAPIDLVARDTTVLDRAISRSSSALTNLAKTIDGYYHAPTRNAATQQKLINDDLKGAVDALDSGAKLITSTPPINALEKPAIVIKSKDLLDQIRKVSDSWVKTKTLIVANGGKQAIGDAVRQQARSANNFASVLISRMPGGDKEEMAKWFEREVNQAVTKSVVAFS